MAYDWMGDAVGRMNNSVLRANSLHDARARAFNSNEDATRQNALADNVFARNMAERQFTQQGDQFNTRMNLLRQLIGQQAPDFFGGGQQAAPQAPRFAAGVGGAVNAPQPQQGGMGGDFNPELRNYLMRYLRG